MRWFNGFQHPCAATVCTAGLCCSFFLLQLARAQGQQDEIQSGVLALRSGKFAAAEASFRSALSRAPFDAGVWKDLGLSLLEQGKSTDAIAAFNRSYKLHPEAGNFALLTAAYCQVGDKDEIAPRLRRAKQYWSDPRVVAELAECYARFGDPLDAVLAYRALVKSRAEPLDRNAVGLTRAYLAASKAFLARLEKAEGNRPYLEAIEDARRTNSLNPDAALPYLRRTHPELNPGADIDELAKSVRENPSSAAILYLMGVRCGELAITTISEVATRFPDSAALDILRADMLSAQGKVGKAEATVSSLLLSVPNDMDFRYELGMLYWSHGDWERAYELFIQVVRAYPEHEPPRAMASVCLLNMGRFQEEIQLLQELSISESPPLWVLLDVARAEEKAGEAGKAIRHLERAVQVYKDDPRAHYRLARLYMLEGRSADSEREFSKFKALKH